MTDVGVERRQIETAIARTAGGSVRRQGSPANSPVRRAVWRGLRGPASAVEHLP